MSQKNLENWTKQSIFNSLLKFICHILSFGNFKIYLPYFEFWQLGKRFGKWKKMTISNSLPFRLAKLKKSPHPNYQRPSICGPCLTPGRRLLACVISSRFYLAFEHFGHSLNLSVARTAAPRQQLAATNGAGEEIRDESARVEIRARMSRMATPNF